MHIEIAAELRAAAPELALGVVTAHVTARKLDEKLWSTIKTTAFDLSYELRGRDLGTLPEIASVRAAYKRLGKDPSRYRGSAEALLKRISQGKDVYQINNVVDVNNLVSLKTRHPVGAYDLSRIDEAVTFRVGAPGETYEGIGKDLINLEGLPLFADGAGPFGSPTSDSRRAMIQLETTRVAIVIISFTGTAKLAEAIALASSLIEAHAAGVDVRAEQVAA